MIYEIATLEIKPGEEEAFEVAVNQASPEFRKAEGCHSLKLERSIENPASYRLIVGWETVEHHMKTFRESDGFRVWRELAGPYFASPPSVEHVTCVLEVF